MKFNSLSDKHLYFRSLTDYRLMPKCDVVVMLDGRAFSKLIKNKFKKPFDDDFIQMMNHTAQYLCKNIQNCKFAYVQSDEISLWLSDYESAETDSFFGYRLSKMLSIIASLAAGQFNKLMIAHKIAENPDLSHKEIVSLLDTVKLAEFDCKAWNVPTNNDVFGWFLYRQIDCIRNSKQQAAQNWVSAKELRGLNTDKQIELLEARHNIKWSEFDDGKKYGRFIYKEKEQFHNDQLNIDYERTVWNIHPAFPLMEENGKNMFFQQFIDKSENNESNNF